MEAARATGRTYEEFRALSPEEQGTQIAYQRYRAGICDLCGHPKSLCHDRKTKGKWKVEHGICQASVAAAVVADRAAETKTRGLTIATRYIG